MALTKPVRSLDESELARLQERAEYFGLNKTDSFNEFKAKYMKAAEEEAENPRSSAQKTSTPSLIDVESVDSTLLGRRWKGVKEDGFT